MGRGRRFVAAVAAAALAVTGACSGGGSDERLAVEAVSTRADMVTGGDVLVRISGLEEGDELRVTVDGDDDVTDAFTVEGGTATGLVTGLPEGTATIEAEAGGASGRLEVENHPITGPVFSGPHQEPFACTTEEHGLGEPTDEDCSAPTVVRWSYVNRSDDIVALDDPTSPPEDVATTELDGVEVPMIVRTESGTIDRGVYYIHVLDPSPAEEAWDPSRWNGTLVHRFGGGCGTTYSQGGSLGLLGGAAGPGADVELLRRGYALATNTFNTLQVACNDVLSAEALMMTLERFVEAFAEPRHVVGEGGSGGAIQQYLIAQNYPGLLDAVVASVPFPDHLSIAPGVTDCGLLESFYATRGADWTPEQRQAVNGHGSPATCGAWVASFLATIDPMTGCALPEDQVYDPETNPEGARCTLPDSNVNLLGTDPETGFAVRPLDNVGVQYGLQALRDGVITVDQFLDLNASIGGYDIDGNVVPERHRAEPDHLERLYATGRINTGGGDLTRIPVFTLDVFTDPTGDIHDRFRAFQLLERTRLEDGRRSPNHVLWTIPGDGGLLASVTGDAAGDVRPAMIEAAVEWLDALDELGVPADDRTPEDLEATRPPSAVDVCVTPDGERHEGGDELYEAGHPCAEAYPLSGDPRTAAGQPIGSLVGKCELVEPDPDGYGVPFTEEQAARLAEVFPEGVCDWSQPGVGQSELSGTWLDYTDGPPV